MRVIGNTENKPPDQADGSTKGQSKAFECPGHLCDELIRIGEPGVAAPGTILFRQGKAAKGVFLLLDGRVAFSAGDDPVRITRIAEKGSLLGLPATVRNKPYSLTAEAVTHVRVCRVPATRFRKMLGENPQLGLFVIRMLAEEISVLRKLTVYRIE